MSATHPISVPHGLWTGIQAKSFACNKIPEIDPARIQWGMTQEAIEKTFFSPFVTELRNYGFEDGDKPEAKSGDKLSAKAGDASEDRTKKIAREFLLILYARWIGKLDHGFDLSPVTRDEKVAFVMKIREAVEHCSPGFIDRLQDLVNGLTTPKTFDEYLCAIRKDLVEKTAVARCRGEVHAKHRFQTVAARTYQTPQPVEDAYTGALTDTQIQALLALKFQENFTFFGILNAFTDQLKSQLLRLGYLGANPPYTGDTYKGPLGYTYQWENFQKVFSLLFGSVPTEVETGVVAGAAAGAGAGESTTGGGDEPRLEKEWFVIDDEDLVTDINWSYVLQRLATKLISEHYVRLKATDLITLAEAQIYDPTFASFEPYSAGEDQVSIFQCTPQSLIEFSKFYPTEMLRLATSSPSMKTVLHDLIKRAGSILIDLVIQSPKAVKPFLRLIETTQQNPRVLQKALTGSKPRYRTPLMEAAKSGNCQLIALLMEKGSDINAIDKNKCSPLIWALQNQQWEAAKVLIEKKANITQVNFLRETALILATHHHAPMDVIVLLLENASHSHLHLKDFQGKSAVDYAKESPTPGAFEVLTKVGITPNLAQVEAMLAFKLTQPVTASNEAYIDGLLETPSFNVIEYFFKVVKAGQSQTVERLSAKRPALVESRLNRETPLTEASFAGHNAIIEILLANGADINAVTESQNVSPLMWALIEGHWDTAMRLLSRPGIKTTNISTPNGNTVLTLAMKLKPPIGVIQQLLDNGAVAVLNHRNSAGKSALGRALECKRFDIAQILIGAGAEISAEQAFPFIEHECSKPVAARNRDYLQRLLGTPGFNLTDCFFKAIKAGQLQTVEILSATFPDLIRSRLHSETPLIAACRAKQADIVQKLLEKGAEINAVTSPHNDSALMWAIDQQDWLSITMLLNTSGIDTSIVSIPLRNTALILAATREAPIGIVQQLLDLDKGGVAVINHRNSAGKSALDYALDYKQFDVIPLLIEAGAQITAEQTLVVIEHEFSNPIATENRAYIGQLLGTPRLNLTDYFFKAVETGQIQAVEILSTTFPDLIRSRLNSETPLIAACRTKQKKMVQKLLGKGAEINAFTSNNHEPALMWAISRKDWGSVMVLLTTPGIDTTLISTPGRQTALILASRWQAPINIIETLLNKGAARRINHRNSAGDSALDYVLAHKRFDVAQRLIEAGAEITAKQALVVIKHEFSKPIAVQNRVYIGQLLGTPRLDVTDYFFKAVKAGQIQAVEILSTTFPDLIRSRLNSETPLIAACRAKQADIVEKLLSKGAEINAVTSKKDSALMWAIGEQEWLSVTMLLNTPGIDTSIVSIHLGNTALILATSWKAPIGVVQKLLDLDKGGVAVINHRNSAGKSALDYALDHKQFDVIPLLIEAGAQITAEQALVVIEHEFSSPVATENRAYLGRLLDTPGFNVTDYFFKAVKAGQTQTVEILSATFPDLIHSRLNNETPLIAACRTKQARIVQRLLEKGAAAVVNHSDSAGENALDYALKNKNFDVARVLIEVGAKITAEQALLMIRNESSLITRQLSPPPYLARLICQSISGGIPLDRDSIDLFLSELESLNLDKHQIVEMIRTLPSLDLRQRTVEAILSVDPKTDKTSLASQLFWKYHWYEITFFSEGALKMLSTMHDDLEQARLYASAIAFSTTGAGVSDRSTPPHLLRESIDPSTLYR